MADAGGLKDGEISVNAVNDDDEEYDSKERVLQKYFLQEWNVVKSILDDIISNCRVSDLYSVHKIRSIFEKYQEQGQLLEPYLESIVCPLMFLIRSKAIEMGATSNEITDVVKPVSIIIYALVTVCGYKTVIKFFPHQVSDLELAVSLLEKCHNTSTSTSLRQESKGDMEAKCVILLWLSILVLVPFDISTVDTSITQRSFDNQDEPPPLVMSILGFCKDYLSSAGPMQSISVLLLSKLLTRPDMSKALTSFTEWSHEILLSSSDNAVDHFQLLGAVEGLASIFQVGARKILLDMVPFAWNDASLLMKSSVAARSPLLRKYLIKLTQRIGLSCLPPRYPSWRYKGRVTLLGSSTSPDIVNQNHQWPRELAIEETISSEHEEDMDVPEPVEEIIEVLLIGLKDTDTVVRWSAAKGIGRITSRLTYSLADEVLSSVLELFSPREGDGAWHGGCLALAELARRGLLLPISLPKVVPVVVQALHYDIRRGPHSVGAHVRDAAAYVCWAFGRAYDYTDMRVILKQLAPPLLTVACYDREVNCRRAAAAAFQENVGRQGNYPHGIDIVNSADYFALSSRVNSYLRVAVSIAQYEGYLHPFVDELLSRKVCHWDKGLRELAAQAISALVNYDPKYFANYVLEKIIPCTLSTDLCTRHGATLAAGDLVLALHKCDFVLPTDQQKQVAGIIPAIEKARLYRGKGGEIMRQAVSLFIGCISLSHIDLSDKVKRGLLDTLCENLRHPNSQIQNTAVNALEHFVQSYLPVVDDKGPYDIISKYLGQLSDLNVAVRRGSALALGVLPFSFLAKRWKDVLYQLCKSCKIEDSPDDRDAEARVNAVKGLVSVCETLTGARDPSCLPDEDDGITLLLFIKTKVMQTLFEALDDYSIDNRGDVGSWVREVAMDGLEKCTYILCRGDTPTSMVESPRTDDVLKNNADKTVPMFDSNIATHLVGGLVKQAVEKMDKLREVAGKVLQRVLYNKQIFVSSIPYRKNLEEIIPEKTEIKWAEPGFSYPLFIQLLHFSCYSRYVVSGLVIAIGGLQDSLRKASLSALLDYLQNADSEDLGEQGYKEQILSSDILWVLERYKRCDRVIVPTLKTIDILLGKKIFLNMKAQTDVFCANVLNAIMFELRGSKDFSKLYSGIAILGYIASISEPINTTGFSHLLTFLAHRYPKIRKACAEQVYLVLLQNVDLVAEDKMEKALEIISETSWEGDLGEAKQRRLLLFEVTGLDSGPILRSSTGPSKKADEKRPASVADENASYSSLVESSGF